MSKRRFGPSLPIDPDTPRPDITDWEQVILPTAVVRIAHVIDAKFPQDIRTGKRGRPKDERAHHAGQLMRDVYENFLKRKIGRSINTDGEIYGPYYRSIKMVLDAIGSTTLPETVIQEQLYPGARKKDGPKRDPTK